MTDFNAQQAKQIVDDLSGSQIEYSTELSRYHDDMETYCTAIEKQANNNISIPNLLTELLALSEEHYTTNGLRFNGVHDEKIKQLFEKNGYKLTQPF